jgi:diguanylate cyclase (GGDEF)-like protein
MRKPDPVFTPEVEKQFHAQRAAALADINATTFWFMAAMLMAFSAWDWFVDERHWRIALAIRSVGAVVILAAGLVQRASRRSDWAPTIAKIRFGACVCAIAGALAVLEKGYLFGCAGLVSVILAGPYVSTSKRDLAVLYAVPVLGTAIAMGLSGLDRFTMINSSVFLVLSLLVGLMLAGVLEKSNRRAFALEQALQREARTDALTDIANRRALEEFGLAELRRGQRSGKPTALILFDLDHFKQCNDDYGHETGDRIIRAVVDALKPVVRQTDCLGRWGGEEFLVILPDTSHDEAMQFAERMRATIASVALLDSPPVRATISLGVSVDDPVQGVSETTRWRALLKAADDAMYRAKSTGRNRVEAGAKVPLAAD